MNFPDFLSNATFYSLPCMLAFDDLRASGFVPLQKEEEVVPALPEYPKDTFPLLRSVKACFDLCVNPNALLLQSGALTVQSVSVLPESVAPWHRVVWIRFNPHFTEHTAELSFHDPFAFDLSECRNRFADLWMTPEKTASLWNLAAPSFPGKVALKLIANFAKICGISTALIHDGSVTLPCCEGAPLASRKLVEIFTHGTSWYERQGASQNALAGDHQTLFENEFALYKLERVLQNTKRGTREELPDTTRIIQERFHLLPTRHVYEKAKEFLYRTTCTKLKTSLSHQKILLHENFEGMFNCELIEEVLQQALKVDSEATIGKLLKRAALPEDPFRQTCRHELLAYLVSNKGSPYYELICQKLRHDGAPPTRLQLALAFSLLSKVMALIEQAPAEFEQFIQSVASLFEPPSTANLAIQTLLETPLLKCGSFIPDTVYALHRTCSAYISLNPEMKLDEAFKILAVFEAPDAAIHSNRLYAEMFQRRNRFSPERQFSILTYQRQFFFEKYEKYSKTLTQQNLSRLDWTNPPSVKTRIYSTLDQRTEFVKNEKVLSGYSFDELLKPSLSYLMFTKVSDFSAYCPQLVAGLHKKYPSINRECTLGEFLARAKAIDIEAASVIIHLLLFEVKEHLESTLEPLFSTCADIDTYFIFMMAKQISEQRIYTALPIR